MANKIESPEGSTSLYIAVRAGFVRQGTSLNAWCVERGVHRQFATLALKGECNGRKANALRADLVEASMPSARAA